MSPLARSLFTLAVVALLGLARGGRRSQCATASIGNCGSALLDPAPDAGSSKLKKGAGSSWIAGLLDPALQSLVRRPTTDNVITLPDIEIRADLRYAAVDIPDNCAKKDRQLVGEVATVCSIDGAVDISLGPAFSPLLVRRSGPRVGPASVRVLQYCS